MLVSLNCTSIIIAMNKYIYVHMLILEKSNVYKYKDIQQKLPKTNFYLKQRYVRMVKLELNDKFQDL